MGVLGLLGVLGVSALDLLLFDLRRTVADTVVGRVLFSWMTSFQSRNHPLSQGLLQALDVD